MSNHTLHDNLLADPDFKQLIAERNSRRDVLLQNKQGLIQSEKSFTIYMTIAGAAGAGFFSFVSLGLAAIVPAIITGLLGAYTAYKAYRLDKDVGEYRGKSDQLQISYDNARDAVRDYTFARIQTVTHRDEEKNPTQTSAEPAQPAKTEWQDRVAGEVPDPGRTLH